MSLPGPGNVSKNIAGTSSATQVAAATYLSVSSRTGISGSQLISMLSANSLQTKGRQGTFTKLMPSSLNVASTATPVELPKKIDNSAAEKAAAEAAAAKVAADKAAREAAIRAEVNAGIAAAEAQYAIELKAAQDKLNASRAAWMAKLNG
jgi:hypothetical protein